MTVNYSTMAGSPYPATLFGGGADLIPVGFAVLTFAPGQSSQTITVMVNQDLTTELTEQFVVTLTGAINATVTDSQRTGNDRQ